MFKRATTLPTFGSLLINAGSGFDECGLCGNSFDVGEFSDSNRIRLPCIDTQCEPCARMWRILSSPTCPACYADFICPKVARNQAQTYSPQLYLGSENMIQQLSPSNSRIESLINFQKRYVAFYDADVDSDDATISDPGSPMKEEEDGVSIVSEFSDDDLREAFILANNCAGTNFNIQEIEDEIPLAILRTGTQTQLADALTQIFIKKASKSDKGSQQPDEVDTEDKTSRQGGVTSWDNPVRCVDCQKYFRSEAHLRQHTVVHTIDRRTCNSCGRVLKNSNSRRIHEKRHRETDSEREERLRKAKVARDQTKAGLEAQKQNRRERVPRVLG